MSRRVPVLAAAGVLAVLVVAAVVAALFAPPDTSVDLGRVLEGPSASHPMGTDEVGRDLAARVLAAFASRSRSRCSQRSRRCGRQSLVGLSAGRPAARSTRR